MSFERLPEIMSRNEQWRAIRIVPNRGLPHWERLPETVAAMEAFWAGSDATSRAEDVSDAAGEAEAETETESAPIAADTADASEAEAEDQAQEATDTGDAGDSQDEAELEPSAETADEPAPENDA